MDDTKNSAYNNPHLIHIFKEEANELINTLECLLLSINKEESDFESVNHIFRVMHTLKGAGGMFGFKLITEYMHKMEDIYDRIRNNRLKLNENILNVTLVSVDHLRNLVNCPDHESIPETQSILLSKLNVLLDSPEGIETEVAEKPVSEPEPEFNSFYIYFAPGLDVLDDGTNPLYLLQDIHSLGKCLIVPYTGLLPEKSVFKADKNYLLWHILLDTDKPINEIEEIFLFLNDKSQPSITQITSSMELTSFEVFTATFKENAQQAEPIKDFDTILKRINPVIKSSLPIEPEELGLNQKTPSNGKDQELNKEVNDIKSNLSSIRVSSDKIDTMMNLISELISKQAELNLVSEKLENPKLIEIAEAIEAISHNLRDNSFAMSLIPLEHSLVRFKRMVRDVSDKFKKKVNFIIEGGQTELDKNIIEGIIDPIMHILRNSIDHGIEMPEERIKAGKPEFGTIMLKAFHSGTNVIIEINDDGNGINLEKVKKTAIKKGYIKENDNPSKEDLLQMIMYPGFSTADMVSEVSGRGVGMDVVSQKVRDVRGELEIETNKGIGTTTTIILPLTISIIDALLVKVGNSHLMISLSSVDSCEEITVNDLKEKKNNYLIFEDNYVPFINLSEEFCITSAVTDFHKVILVKYLDTQVGLIVDQILGKYQAVLKPLGEIYKKHEIISGASILGNGEIALVLDTNKLIRKYSLKRKIAIKNRTSTSII